jgi:hypothetical protein
VLIGHTAPALPCRVREPTTPAVDLAALDAIALPDPDGAEHRLGSFWSDAPAIVVFLRHFG